MGGEELLLRPYATNDERKNSSDVPSGANMKQESQQSEIANVWR